MTTSRANPWPQPHYNNHLSKGTIIFMFGRYIPFISISKLALKYPHSSLGNQNQLAQICEMFASDWPVVPPVSRMCLSFDGSVYWNPKSSVLSPCCLNPLSEIWAKKTRFAFYASFSIQAPSCLIPTMLAQPHLGMATWVCRSCNLSSLYVSSDFCWNLSWETSPLPMCRECMPTDAHS